MAALKIITLTPPNSCAILSAASSVMTMSACGYNLTLGSIMTHIGGTEARVRCLIEGEEVFNAGHIVCCGVKTVSSSSCTIQGLCIQTSQVRQKPHELWFELRSDGSIVTGHCSCKAGNSVRCKHMIAMLLFAQRAGIANLEQLTSTDLTQAWGKLKGNSIYEPRRVKDLCHVRPFPAVKLDQAKLETIRRWLIGAAPGSALAKHAAGRCLQNIIDNASQSSEYQSSGPEASVLISHIIRNKHVQEHKYVRYHEVAFKDWNRLIIYPFTYDNLSEDLSTFYQKKVVLSQDEAVNVCRETAGQDNTRWQRERMVRITGSKCHTLYRFIPQEAVSWEQKICKLLTNNFAGNEATRRGKACEKPALEEYALSTGEEVCTFGLVVNPELPWLGFSPDGILFRDGKPEMLIEIKSPVLGKTERIVDLVKQKKIPYILCDGENYYLRPTHCYYTQIQLGLFLLGLQAARLIVYSEVESLVIVVNKSVTFVDDLIKRLQFVYFSHYLPELVKYTK